MTASALTKRNQTRASRAVTLPSKIDAFLDSFVNSLDIKPRSREAYRKGVLRFLRWMQAKGITQPTRTDILTYKEELRAQYKACTVSSYLTAVRVFFTYLAAEMQKPNIAQGIKGAKTGRGFRKDSLSIDQTKTILAGFDRSTLEGMRNFALVNLLVRTGLRTIEAVRADISDIRNEGGKAVLYIQGKGRDAKDAFVVLTDATLKPIKAYLQARGRLPEGAPLFASLSDRNQGGRLTTRSISRIVKEGMRAVDIDDERLTAHSLRHTAVTLSLLAGADLQQAQALARHSNVNTTLIYAHNLNRIKEAPEALVDSVLDAA